MNKDYVQICYTEGCDNYSTIALKIPLGPRIHCIVHICDACLPKYQLDENDRIHHQHRMATRS
jgi:hypothetical protein